MNAGFSNLADLKKELLATSQLADKRFDQRILSIGLGVASQFERSCNREWKFAEGILEVCSGDRPFWFTRRAPVSVFSKVELRYFRTDDWTDISGQPLAADEEKGLLDFGYTLGRDPIQVRITYTGGYFWNQSEPDAAVYPDAVPAAITANAAGLDPAKFYLPYDLKLAWLTQCRKVWEAIDKVGDKILDVGSNTRQPSEALAGLDFVPMVTQTLKNYTRYQLT